MELQGKIILIKETETVGANGFQKREFVIETADQYPQKIKLEFTKDKCGLLDNYAVGANVKVDFNLRGSEYNGKYYVTVQAWKIGAATAAAGGSAPRAGGPTTARRPAAGPRAGGSPAPRQPQPPVNDAGGEDAPW